jgi:predicted amidohydrolase YtcJ
VGKLADLVVLSDNLLTMNPDGIKDVDVIMTLVGGKLVYEK